MQTMRQRGGVDLFFVFEGEGGVRDKLVTGVQTCAFFFQAEDGIRDKLVTGVQTCALPISPALCHGALAVASKPLTNEAIDAAIARLQEWISRPVRRLLLEIGRASCRERV